MSSHAELFAEESGRERSGEQPVALEAWGGVECTWNRVGDRYFDQTALSGHDRRLGDYARIASLGIETLRFGLLWERWEAEGSWRWFDGHLHAMLEAGIRPVAGLLHHGSGPPHTSLLDPGFGEKLARYAGEVAARYPWIDAYTPVNEPHTTARFSARYGVWYPHHLSARSFYRALLHQVRGTVLSMQAIRAVQPEARLIQTEDLGRVWGTPELAATVDLVNQRRWLPFDLLAGRVDRAHPLFAPMVQAGLAEREILWFAEHPCPANVIGVNYYTTSDRFLDHRVELYGDDRRSAEGPYADVEAVRVRPEGIAGFGALLTEGWERFRGANTELAITEVHLGCSVDEQVRWAAEAWRGAQAARAAGVECVAMTFWALLGSFYWNSLVTEDNGYYEPGVFAVHNGELAETELAALVKQIAAGDAPSHPWLAEPGWWARPDRIHFTEPSTCNPRAAA